MINEKRLGLFIVNIEIETMRKHKLLCKCTEIFSIAQLIDKNILFYDI